MASTSNSLYPKNPYPEDFIPIILQPFNYFEWKNKLLELISDKGLAGFIDGTVLAPIPSPGAEMENQDYSEWKRRDDLVKEWILNALPPRIREKMFEFKPAKEVWEDVESYVNETKKKLISHYLPLHKAAMRGDWAEASKIIDEDPSAVRAQITEYEETALIVAVASAQRNNFVKQLLDKMWPEELAHGDQLGRTALHRAAKAGNLEVVQRLVAKNPDLPNLADHKNRIPLFHAAKRGDKDVVLCLMDKSKTLEGESGFRILQQLTTTKLYGIALTVLQSNPKLAYFIPNNENALKAQCLHVLALQPSSFRSGTDLSFWQRLIYSVVPLELKNIADHHSGGDIENPAGSFISVVTDVKLRLQAFFWKVAEKSVPLIKNIREKKLLHQQAVELLKFVCKETVKSDFFNARSIFILPLLQATSNGIREIVEEILDSYPDTIYVEYNQKQALLKQAIILRRYNVFNLIHKLAETSNKTLLPWDPSQKNALHLAGELSPQQQLDLRAGAALQMQRELQWFNEVEKFVPLQCKEERNEDDMTPAEVFSHTHKELIKEGERWMKDTASSCTIVAALIATVVFAAAFTVPGGNTDKGLPIFSNRMPFIIFGLSDAVALSSSIASVLMFLSILTSRYAEEDFLYALPKRLIIGLITLFVSILSMMTAFGATLYLIFGDKKDWVLIPIVLLGCLPVTLFGSLQFPLLVDMIKSTYGPGIFGKQRFGLLG